MMKKASSFALALAIACAACGGLDDHGVDGDEGDDSEASTFSAATAAVGGRARVVASGGLRLRTQPNTSARIILVMSRGSIVDVLARSSGWFSVKYQGTVGWSYGEYLEAWSEPSSSGGGSASSGSSAGGASASPGTSSAGVQAAMERARSGVGFSYWWGGGCWSPGSSSAGACYGSCPNCSHDGAWGADCSGYASKVWQVPGPEDLTDCSHPYNTDLFYDTNPYWSDVPRSSARQGDAFVRHGHMFIYDRGDPWGSLVAYEAKGCHYGIVHNSRTADSSYKVIRRNGF